MSENGITDQYMQLIKRDVLTKHCDIVNPIICISITIQQQLSTLIMENNANQDSLNDYIQLFRPNHDQLKGDQAKIQNDQDLEFMIQYPERTLHSSQKKTSNSMCSRKQSAKNSTAKYREKKKKQLNDLEQSVKQLENQLENTDQQIQNVKQKILTALQTLAKMNQRSSNENIEIYNQLETLLGKPDSGSPGSPELLPGFVDFDKINLLLDTLKYRIGASGRERQSKLSYHYKSIVNTIFPALYRYILFSSMHNFDIFQQQHQKLNDWEWTKQLINKLDVKQHQVGEIKDYKKRLQKVYQNTNKGIMKLNQIRQKLRQEGQKVEGIQQQMRLILNPIQCARWTIFAQKYKYRRQIMLDLGFFQNASETNQGKTSMSQKLKLDIAEQRESSMGINGRKRVKISKQ